MSNLITRRNRCAREQGGIFKGILASWMQQHLWTLHKNFDEVTALCHTIELCSGEMTGKDLLSQEELSWYRTKFQVVFHMKNFSVPEGYFMSQELNACLSQRAVSPALLVVIIILNIRMAWNEIYYTKMPGNLQSMWMKHLYLIDIYIWTFWKFKVLNSNEVWRIN